MSFRFDTSYARLPARFYARVAPTPVADPRLIRLNAPLAHRLGLDAEWLASADGVAVLAGNRPPDGAQTLATVYAGHQFGGLVPRLGDGRAILLGEVVAPDGARFDVQLKGAGPTPFSRGGDGRAPLGPVLREYAVSEAMAALGVPTTRALGAVATGEPVARETLLPGAVLTRVASSHIRVGTFQFFAMRGDVEALRLLADHVIERHYPDAAHSDAPYRALLGAVVGAQARLIARWMLLGFVHGVMNTDNTSVAGETIDYGPCAFVDTFDPAAVFSAIDRGGRYAYRNQPAIGLWNLTRFAECLLPLLAGDTDDAIAIAQALLAQYETMYTDAYKRGLTRKIGLPTPRAGDAELAGDLLAAMHAGQADFTLTFRRLADAVWGEGASVRELFADAGAFDAWEPRWRARIADEERSPDEIASDMDATNPLYIPRNHLVEAALRAAIDEDDLEPFGELVDVLARPFEQQPGRERYALPPRPDQRVTRTFCGT
jgi:uncharacterized protein YdiU (UPF0061 family)